MSINVGLSGGGRLYWYDTAACLRSVVCTTYVLLIWRVIGLDIKCEKMIHIKSHISSSNDYDCMIYVHCTMDTITFIVQRHCCVLYHVFTVICSSMYLYVVVHPNTLYISSSRIHRWLAICIGCVI